MQAANVTLMVDKKRPFHATSVHSANYANDLVGNIIPTASNNRSTASIQPEGKEIFLSKQQRDWLWYTYWVFVWLGEIAKCALAQTNQYLVLCSFRKTLFLVSLWIFLWSRCSPKIKTTTLGCTIQSCIRWSEQKSIVLWLFLNSESFKVISRKSASNCNNMQSKSHFLVFNHI